MEGNVLRSVCLSVYEEGERQKAGLQKADI